MAKELMIPPAAEDDPKAVEILRVWAAHGAQHVTLAWNLWPDSSAWGIVLADLAGHVANAYQQECGADRNGTLDGIRSMFNAELDAPTDAPEGKVHNSRRPHRRQRP